MNHEQWAPCPIPEFFTLYEVSDHGHIRRIGKANGATYGRVRKPFINNNGYAIILLYRNNCHFPYLVSRLVCTAFHGPPLSINHVAAHRDGDKLNNHATNLRWATNVENEMDKIRLGRKAEGERHGHAKLKETDILLIRQLLQQHVSQACIARQFDVSQSTISHIGSRIIWRMA